MATKVSLTERKSCQNSFHALKNQRLKPKSDLYECQTPPSLKKFEKKSLVKPEKGGDCLELANFEMNPSFNVKARENIYHRKVLYMR